MRSPSSGAPPASPRTPPLGGAGATASRRDGLEPPAACRPPTAYRPAATVSAVHPSMTASSIPFARGLMALAYAARRWRKAAAVVESCSSRSSISTGSTRTFRNTRGRGCSTVVSLKTSSEVSALTFNRRGAALGVDRAGAGGPGRARLGLRLPLGLAGKGLQELQVFVVLVLLFGR